MTNIDDATMDNELLVKFNASPPFISIVLPCFNESTWIDTTLSALEKQCYPKECYEIIAVDNNSTDATKEIIQKHFQVKLLVEPRHSSYIARNLGVMEAKGDWIAFLDADCIPHSSWLSKLLETACTENSFLVGGRIENHLVKTNLANALLAFRLPPEKRKLSIVHHNCVSGGNMLVHKSLFEKYGLFQPVASGGDIEFSKRVAISGESIAYAEKAIVEHQCDLSNSEYLKRAFRIRYGQELNSRSKITTRRFIENLLSLPLRPGFTIPRKVASSIPGITFSYSAILFYIWIERWMGYWGGLVGTVARVQKDIRKPND